MQTRQFWLGVLCASTSLTAWTMEPLHAQENTQLSPVIVTAPGTSSPAQQIYGASTRPSPGYAASDGGDYLKSLPGITSGRFGGHGLEPVIRGQSQNQLNIIADDSYIFGGCPNRMDPPTSYLNIGSYDTITVTKGYQSVLNGPGASGGAIILERSKPEESDRNAVKADLTGGYDSNSKTWNSAGKLQAATQDYYVRATGSVKDAGNYKDGNGNRVRSSFTEHSGGITLGATPKDSHIYASYDHHKIKDALFPGAGMDSPLSEGDTFKFGGDKEYASGFLRKVGISAYASLVDHLMDNYSLRTPGAMLRKVASESDTYGGKVKSDLSLGNQIINLSLEYRRNNRDADRTQGATVNTVNTLQSVMWPDITANEIGFGLETTYHLSPLDRLTIGGRYDYVHVNYGRANQIAAATGMSANDAYRAFYGYGASNQHEHNVGGLVRYEHDLSSDLTVFTGMSRSVRTADATERGLANWMVMMGNNRSWVGNPHIKPEGHHQIDLGLMRETSTWRFSTSAYVNYVDNYILRDSARGQNGILLTATDADVYRNIDALLAGFELQTFWQVTPDVSLTGDATYTYGENLDDNMALAQIPPLQGTLGVNWQVQDNIELGSSMRWALKQTRVDTDATSGTGRDVGKTPGYAVFDVKATLTNLNPLKLSLGVSNIFDKTYATHLNRSNVSDPTEVQVNEAGRSFFIQADLPL